MNNRLRNLTLVGSLLVSGAVGALLGGNAVKPQAPLAQVTLPVTQPIAALTGGAESALAAALPIVVVVTSVSISPASNSYCESVSLAPSDTSGLSSFSESWCGSGTTPRYPIGASATLSLP